MGYLYTTLQFILLGLILLTPPVIPVSYFALSLLIISVIAGLWAIWTFRHTKINVFPYLLAGARLIQRGPYRYVRHPMYTAVLLFSLAYFSENPNWLFFLYFIALLAVIILKIKFEERRLKSRFDDYQTVFYKTYRLLPCIY